MAADKNKNVESEEVIEQTEGIIEPEELVEQAVDMVGQISEYGFLIMDSLKLLIIGMVIIFVLHKLASVVLYPRIGNLRLVKVIIGALYVLVLTVTVLVALREIGFDVQIIARIALLSILIGAVVVFFLVPFLPRLPFLLGHMVEINTVLGTVDAISSFHTTLRKFDGTMVFIPNALVMASRILNFHDTPTRRIDMNFSIKPQCDLEYAKQFIEKVMAEDERVLKEPAPVIFIMGASATSVEMTGYCWVLNEHWLSARSDLWLKAMTLLRDDNRIEMAIPEQAIYLNETGKKTGE